MLFLFYGQRENGENVFASEEWIGERIYCPICQGQLRIKKSSLGRYFFVHYQKCDKDYGEGSKHLFWKQHIMNCLGDKEAKEEVVFENRRRGDIYVEKVSSVVEIQFSTISVQELARRIDDYQTLNLKQFWLFQWPKIKKDQLVLSLMAFYIWEKTNLPLIYIDDQKKCLYLIKQLQFVGNRRAFYEYQVYPFELVLEICRTSFEKNEVLRLQNKWYVYYRREIQFLNERNKRYRTQLAKHLYYLSSKGITIETIGKRYTANVFFTTSPVVWQTECLYLHFICEKTIKECAQILQKQMIKNAPDAEIIVRQLLEQFSVAQLHNQ